MIILTIFCKMGHILTNDFRCVKGFVKRAEKKLSDMYGEKIVISSLEFDAYTCPSDFELDNIKLHLV